MKRISMLAVLTTAVWATLGGGVAFAAGSVHLCVGEEAGSPVRSGGATGSCKAKETPVALPSEESEQQKLLSILPYINYVASGVGGKPTIQVSGANLQVLNGTGHTSEINGAGNLIIGYDESASCPGVCTQTGSHNLVLGEQQSYESVGSVLGGSYNTATHAFTDVFGAHNTAGGYGASVTGGVRNTASGTEASVSGGGNNKATNLESSVSGGAGGTASGEYSAVSGGGLNTASFVGASISGGYRNVVSANSASIAGGEENTVSGGLEGKGGSISGGQNNKVEIGKYAWVGGGSKNVATGEWSAVSGGEDNNATAYYSSIMGGDTNTASGQWSSVSGGELNAAKTKDAWIGGGAKNETFSIPFTKGEEGLYAAIFGGKENKTAKDYDAIP
jgi:hypothetical protein